MKGKAIVLENISMQFGGQILFEEANVSFLPGNRYALTGPNGSGKSTLLKIIVGKEKPLTGNISAPARTGMLCQHTEPFKDMKLKDVVIQGNPRLSSALEELYRLYDEQNPSDQTGLRIAELQDVIYEEDGYSAESTAETLLMNMHIGLELHDMPLKAIPSHMQLRVLLCQALFGSADALLLDEPTNFLDLETIGWLEKFLAVYPGVVVLSSHDRHFLNSVATHVADIDYETIILYPGDYNAMTFAKTSAREQAEAGIKAKSKKIAQLRQFMARFSAGTRASQVRSREREVERLQPELLKKSNIQRPYIRFDLNKKASGERVLLAKNISFAYEKEEILSKTSFEILRGDRVAVIGNNGAGKTTLLKLLVEQLAPKEGTVEQGHNLLTAYFPQNHTDTLGEDRLISVFEWLRNKNPKYPDQTIREALGRVLFSGDSPAKAVGSLSGGETARLLLADITLKEHNLLVLDEPNNHMDIESVFALGQALKQYSGTVILASHDRDLIETVSTKVISVKDNKATHFSGPYSEWIASKTGAGKKK